MRVIIQGKPLVFQRWFLHTVWGNPWNSKSNRLGTTGRRRYDVCFFWNSVRTTEKRTFEHLEKRVSIVLWVTTAGTSILLLSYTNWRVSVNVSSLHLAMMSFPYSFFSCPCVDVSVSVFPALSNKANEHGEEDEEKSFDPRSPRANFSLFPLDHLMWCEDCHEIRCATCTVEEIVCWYCPSCLFEIPSSMVKSEGNR